MTMLNLKILDKNHNTKAVGTSNTMAVLVHTAPYEEGDIICLEAGTAGCHCLLQLDDAMLPAAVYLKGNVMYYQVPHGEKRAALSPKAFHGSCHVLNARLLTEDEVKIRRNLALNPYDGHSAPGLFPHADANVETRNEAVFAARNAIDGIYANNSHGKFPYGSWGINQKPDAEWKLDFGREVLIDEIRLTLRADFPHDSYWTEATVEFSDGSVESFHLDKTAGTQCFPLQQRKVDWLLLKNLIKAKDESPFPALTQLEAWGRDC